MPEAITNSAQAVEANLKAITADRADPDLFHMERPQFRSLIGRAEDISGGAPHRTTVVSSAEARRRKIAASKYEPLAVMRGNLELLDTWGISDTRLRMLSPAAFLSCTSPGEVLLDELLRAPHIANTVLARIDLGGRMLGGNNSSGVPNKTTIVRPFHAFLDNREGLINRVSKYGFDQLIQKQERLLQRIGATADLALTAQTLNGERIHADPNIEMFKSLWGHHVQGVGQTNNLLHLLTPSALTYSLFETLAMTCNYRIRTLISEGRRAYDKVEAAYPLKKVTTVIASNGVVARHREYFTDIN